MKFFQFIKREKGQDSRDGNLDVLTQELKAIKKSLRKQGLLLEKVEQSLDRQGQHHPDTDLYEALMDFATSLFLLEQGISSAGLPAGGEIQKALYMVQDKLHALLGKYNMEMIKETGKPFNPAYHECVRRSDGDDSVKLIVSPGFILNGRVLRPAKVIV